MHELQEEYLVVVRYDVKSYGDLFRLKLRLQRHGGKTERDLQGRMDIRAGNVQG